MKIKSPITIIAIILSLIGVTAGAILIREKTGFVKKAAGETATLSFTPTSVQLARGRSTAINLVVNPSSKPIVGVDVIVKFDTNYLTLSSITPRPDLSNLKTFAPIDTQGNFNSAQVISRANSTGIIEFGAVAYQWNPEPGVVLAGQISSINPLATLNFVAKSSAALGPTTVAYSYQALGATTDSNIVKQWLASSEPRPADYLASPTTKTTITITSPTSPTPTRIPTRTPTPNPYRTPTPIPTRTPTPPPTAPGALNLQITAGGNDVNEDGSEYSSNSYRIWIGNGQSTTASNAGLRFTAVNLRRGAKITSAKIYLYNPSDTWISTCFIIAAHASGNSPTFSSTSKPSSRTLTSAKVPYCSDVKWLANSWYSLPDITPVIQELVNRSDWTQNGSISLVLKGNGSAWGRKFLTSYESSSANAPKLQITYSSY